MESIRCNDGARIVVERRGSGRPLVLVHGTLDDHRYWAPVLSALADRFAVSLVNRRGRCGSSPHGRDHTVERDAEDIATVLRAIAEPAHLVGHSSGARYALHAARLVPSLSSLTLYEPPPFEPPPPSFLQRLQELTDAEDRDAIVTAFWSEMVGLSAGEIKEIHASSTWKIAVSNAHTLLPELRSFAAYKFDPGSFANFQVPTLLMSGSESPPFLREEVEALAAILPQSHIATLEGQAHEAIHTAPELFLDTLVSFLDEHAGSNR